MTRRIIIHIGMHKTGSTSIQNTLFRGLHDASFEYADLGCANHSMQIFSLFSGSPEKYHLHRRQGRGKEGIERFNLAARERLVRYLNGRTAQNVIISGEDISVLAEEELRHFRHFFIEHFTDLEVVGYVRPPRSFMESAIQMRIRGNLLRLSLGELYPKYRQRFEKFDRIFGREQVHLWKFAPKTFPEGDVVLDFCKRLGIAIQPEAAQRVNESLSRDAISLLFVYRKFGPGFGVGARAVQENNQLITALRSIGGGRLRFAPEMIAPVLEANRADIQWMEERLDEPLDEDQQGSVDDVRSAADLLNIRPAAIDALKDLLGKDLLPEGIAGQTPQEAAVLVHALREKLAAKQPLRRRPLLSDPGMGVLSTPLPLKPSIPAAVFEPGLIVLGMHRSGTSCLAGMLQSAGFAAPEIDSWDMYNQRGNRENVRLVHINDAVLRQNHTSWDNPPVSDICAFIGDDIRLKRNAVLLEFAALGRPWMFKDPRTLLTLPFWREAVPHPYRIGIFRHPIRVALSLYYRSQMPIARSLSLWLAYNRALVTEHERSPFPLLCFDLPPAVFLNSAVAAVQQECGGLIERGLLDPAKMRSFYAAELVHHNDSDPEKIMTGLPADDEIVKEARSLYERLCSLAGVAEQTAFKAASKDITSDPLATLMTADKAVQEGDIDLALKLYRQALPTASNALDIWHRIITMLQDHRRYEEAVRACDEALRSFPADPGLLLAMAVSKEQSGCRGEALEIIERILTTMPAWIKPWSLKGEWLFSEGRWSEAIEALQQCIPHLPPGRAWPRHARMAEAFFRAGRADEGNAAFQKALALAPPKSHAAINHRWSQELQAAGQQRAVERAEGVRASCKEPDSCRTKP